VEVRGDLPGRQAFAVNDSTISSIPDSRRRRLRTMIGLELASIPRGDVDLDRADLGEHGLGPGAVTRVGVPAGDDRLIPTLAGQ
jgi:hypothetical protein